METEDKKASVQATPARVHVATLFANLMEPGIKLPENMHELRRVKHPSMGEVTVRVFDGGGGYVVDTELPHPDDPKQVAKYLIHEHVDALLGEFMLGFDRPC